MGTIINNSIINTHTSLNGKFIFAKAYPARPLTIILKTISIAA